MMLKRAWMLQEGLFCQNWMAFSHYKEEQRMAFKAFPDEKGEKGFDFTLTGFGKSLV